MHAAELIVVACWWYGAVGLAVAALFLLFGLDRIDANAHGRFAFRPLLAPGLALLWPIVAARWMKLERRHRHAESKPETEHHA